MKKRGRILHIDDDYNFLDLFILLYKSWFDIKSVDTFKEFRRILDIENIDLVITDYEMPEVNGLEVLNYVKSNFPDLPVIFYTGQGNEDIAREAFVSGAADYFTKDFSGFGYKDKIKNSILNVIERNNLKKELRKSEEIHRLLTRHACVGIATHRIVLDETGKPVDFIFLSVNPAFETQTGLKIADILGRHATEVIPGIEETSFIETFGRVALTGKSVNFEEFCPPLGRSYFISAYKLDEGLFTTVINDITERKKAEESVKESHDRLLAIFDSIDEPVYVADPNTYEVVFANRVLKDAFGEAGNRKCYEYLQNLKTPCPFCTNEKILGEYLGRSYVWEFKNKANKRWYKCIDKAINWPDGRMVRYEMGIDITELKRIEDELHTSRDLLNTAQQLTRVGGWEWDMEKETVTWATDSYLIYGLDHGEIEAGSPENIQRCFNCYDPEDRPIIKAAFRRCVEKGETFNLELPITTLKGERRWLQTMGRPLMKGNKLVKVLGNFIDITEKKKAEEILRLQALVLDQIKDHVTITDLNGVITYVNKAQEEMLGFSKQEIIGRSTMIYGEDSQKGATQREIVETTCRDGFWRGEVVNYSKNGTEIIMDCRTQVVYDENEKPTALCGIATNITERKRVEETLQKRNAELMEFANTISCSLKNPINLLADSLSVIKQDPSLFGHYFDKVTDLKNEITLFIDNLLQLAKSAQIESNTSKFCLEDLFRKIFEMTKPHDIHAELITHSDNTEFEGDIGRFEQLYSNLILNSIKFRDPGKENIIIEFGCKHDTEGILMSVKDNGMGIENPEIDKVFKVGYTSDKKYGSGFGLTIVSKIVETYSGKIHAESKGKGTGTTFYIHIPNTL